MTRPTRAYVDQQAISIRNMPDLLDQIDTSLSRDFGFTVYTLNLDHLVKRRQNPDFRRLYGRATFVTADGWPIVRLARRQDPAIDRTPGADLIVPLCRLAARRRMPIALFGSTKSVLAAAAAKLGALCPGLDVVMQEAPPFGFDPLGEEGAAMIARMESSGARLCFVALGAPKQEIFSDRAVARGAHLGFICIGAGLDFIAGAQVRAPRRLQALKLEWAWRFVVQPRRMGLRYFRCAVLYARLLVGAGAQSQVESPR